MPGIANSAEKYHIYSSISFSDEDRSLSSEDESLGDSPLNRKSTFHLKVLYFVNGLLLLMLGGSWVFVVLRTPKDPSLGIWCQYTRKKKFINCADAQLAPADNAVEYKTVTFDSYFFNRSPYLGTPVEEKDAMWESLYDCENFSRSIIYRGTDS